MEATGLGKLLRDAAVGLDFVHSQGYVHNDVSLDNLLTRQDGTVVLLDFGSASRVGGPARTFGKHRFMAPERINGSPVDGRADQFSLAIVAFDRITEKYPFLGEGPTVLNAIVRDAPLTLAAAGMKAAEHLQWVFDKAFQKNPSDRFESCSKFVDALSQAPKA